MSAINHRLLLVILIFSFLHFTHGQSVRKFVNLFENRCLDHGPEKDEPICATLETCKKNKRSQSWSFEMIFSDDSGLIYSDVVADNSSYCLVGLYDGRVCLDKCLFDSDAETQHWFLTTTNQLKNVGLSYLCGDMCLYQKTKFSVGVKKCAAGKSQQWGTKVPKTNLKKVSKNFL